LVNKYVFELDVIGNVQSMSGFLWSENNVLGYHGKYCITKMI